MPTKSSKKRRSPKKGPMFPFPLPPSSIPRGPMASTPELEGMIARLLLLRYEHDIARLFSTHIHRVASLHVPKLMERIMLAAGSPGWCAVHAADDVVKDFYRGVLAMDLRQAGERVAPRSLEWSYTSLRHFAISHDVQICKSGDHGLQPYRLLPYLPQLQAYLAALEALPPPTFSPLAHLPQPSAKGIINRMRRLHPPTQPNWEERVALGYARLVDAMWAVAGEFGVSGYGLVLRQKLAGWCDCGCSTEHLGEVCERTVRGEEAARSGKLGEGGREKGKGREWDGRGGGVYGWGTAQEEDVWEKSLDVGGCDGATDWEDQMTMGELMEWRYLKAEREKERGNEAFKAGKYGAAIAHYLAADGIEPELPHYRLNAAQAYLQLGQWASAERLCTSSLRQHAGSVKALWRRARARRMQGKPKGAAKDLRALLKIQPHNPEALAELHAVSQQPNSNSTASPSPYPPASSLPCPASSSKAHAPPPLPWEPEPRDHRRLAVRPLPVSLTMPDTMLKETFAYPSWERYKIEVVV